MFLRVCKVVFGMMLTLSLVQKYFYMAELNRTDRILSLIVMCLVGSASLLVAHSGVANIPLKKILFNK